MKTLANTFEKWGSTWTVLERTEDWALIRQDHKGGRPNYNVCKIKKTKDALMPNGRTIPAQEMIPCAEEYGRIAWCYCELENAEKKYDEMAFGK